MRIPAFRSAIVFSAGMAIGIACTAFGISGCGGKSSGKVVDQTADGDSDEDATPAEPEDEAPKQRKSVKGNNKKKAKGDQLAHIGEIPKDVWPEVWLKDPSAVAREVGAAATPAADAGSADDAGTKPAPTEVAANTVKAAAPDAKAGSSSDWAALISGEALADESKAIKNKLTAQMADVGRYNSTYKEMRVEATIMAVLAAIAADVPESPSWKANAKFIRDAASKIAAESTANGQKFYDKAKKEYDKLDGLLGGSKPPDVEDTPEKINFSEVANRFYLMKRMERTTVWMKTEVNSEAAFKKEGAKLTQEGSLLALLGKVITTPDYGDHDLEEYQGYAGTVSQAGRSVVAAVKDGDFKAYTAALDSCQKACNKCHEQFKNN
ncbi:MAG: hypothetical protein HY290_03295 [Planctomycetia bacterium]|nr:hypothetical protein [Planctomycetia bacterium]